MQKELLFIVVIGHDQKGIVAKVSDQLYKSNINIEDISQKIMAGYFVMTMLVDVSEAKYPLDKIRASLDKLGKSLDLVIQLHHENIFKMMHRI